MIHDVSLLPSYGGPDEPLLPSQAEWDACLRPETIEVTEYRVVRMFTYSEGEVDG